MSTNHPFHPAAVHFPITFLLTAYGIDALRPLLHYVPADLAGLLPSEGELGRVSYYALSAGLVTSVPAVLSGIIQASAVMQKHDSIYNADKKTLKPKIKTLFGHAAINDVVLIASGWYWWTRRQAGGPTFQPTAWMISFGVVVSAVLILAANMGGTLVYNYGTGFSAAKSKSKEH